MDKEHSGREHIHPSLLSLIDMSDEVPWLFVRDLKNGDVLEIQTRNTLYTMKVTDPENGKVMVNSNGQRITQEAEASVLGTTITGTGTMVKYRGITVGLSLVVFVKGVGELILSPTQEVRVNGFKALPLEDTEAEDTGDVHQSSEPQLKQELSPCVGAFLLIHD